MSKQHFSNRIKEHEAPLDPAAWEAMDALLDGKVAKPGANGSGRKYLWLILLLVVLSAAGLYGSGVLEQNREANDLEKLSKNNHAVSDQLSPSADPEGSSEGETKSATDQTNEKNTGPVDDPAGKSDLSSRGKNDTEQKAQSAKQAWSSNSTDSRSDGEKENSPQQEAARPNSTDGPALKQKPAEIREQSMTGLNDNIDAPLAVERKTEGHEKAQVVENSAGETISKDLTNETNTSEPVSVKGKNNESVDNHKVEATPEEAVNEAKSSLPEFVEEQADTTIVKVRDVPGIAPSIIPGTGGDIPSGFTTIRMDGYESRPKGVPQPEVSNVVTTFPIENVSFFIGYAEAGTRFGFPADKGLTGGRFNLGVSYTLSDRLRLETEYGNTNISFVGQVSNGQKNEKVSFRGQHVHLKYRLAENNFGELRLYGGGGYGKYVYDSFVNPQTGPFAPPIEIVNEASNVVSLDFGLAGLCTWSNIWLETRFGIMHNQAFNGGSIILNYGASIYFNPWKNRK
ncbi:MAG: hypothetical protein Roseis2KO_48200 [Roseivirga sp.]